MLALQRKSLWAAAIMAASLGLAACAAIPTIEPPAADSGVAIQPIRIRGPRGPLSSRETARILKNLNAQVPDVRAFDRHLAIEQYVAGSPLYTGNRVTILRDGPQTFAAMFQAIRQAKHYLYLEYYILEDVNYGGEQLGDLLIQRHQQGVQIDIIYDDIGSLSTPAEFFQRLQSAGIQVRKFNPITKSALHINDRDHRKILIADSSTAIVGGVNLSTTYQSAPERGSGSSGRRSANAESLSRAAPAVAPAASSPAAPAALGDAASPSTPVAQGAPAPATPVPWHDTDLQIDGPVVTQLKTLFEEHWRQQGGPPEALAAFPDPPTAQGDQIVRIIGSQGGQTMPRYYATLLSAIRSASSRIWVEAAYFVPTYQERQALSRAARRGVDVRLLLPSKSDSAAVLAVQHSYYGGLLRAGVQIHERDDGILHSKTAVMDGVWSIVGSSNFDHRSVLFNDEVDAVVIGDKTGQQLEQFFRQDLEHAQRITLATWRSRSFSQRVRESFWRLWQQLL